MATGNGLPVAGGSARELLSGLGSALLRRTSSGTVAAPASEEADRVLRESEALLALLQKSTTEAHECSMSSELPRPVSESSTKNATTCTEEQGVALNNAVERLLAARGTPRLRQELAAFMSNAQLPLGAELCQIVGDFRRAHALTAGPPRESGSPLDARPPGVVSTAPPVEALPAGGAEAEAGAASAAAAGVTAAAAVALERLLSWRLTRPFSFSGGASFATSFASSSLSSAPAAASASAIVAAPGSAATAPSALESAVHSAQAGLKTLRAKLDAQLPDELKSDDAAYAEARSQLDSALHRSLFSSIWPLYLATHSKAIDTLAPRCHELRMLLPCDLVQLPPELWLLPDGNGIAEPSSSSATNAAAPDDSSAQLSTAAALAELRTGGAGGASDARLPYASAIQLLHTISFYRTPFEKAKVLLEACEEVVKCATRAFDLAKASARARAADDLASPEAGGAHSALCADNLLPLFIYVVVRSGVYSLPAELAYVQDFLGEGLAHGQLGYALVSLQCACHYAQELSWGQGLLQPKPVEAHEAHGQVEEGDRAPRGASSLHMQHEAAAAGGVDFVLQSDESQAGTCKEVGQGVAVS